MAFGAIHRNTGGGKAPGGSRGAAPSVGAPSKPHFSKPCLPRGASAARGHGAAPDGARRHPRPVPGPLRGRRSHQCLPSHCPPRSIPERSVPCSPPGMDPHPWLCPTRVPGHSLPEHLSCLRLLPAPGTLQAAEIPLLLLLLPGLGSSAQPVPVPPLPTPARPQLSREG